MLGELRGGVAPGGGGPFWLEGSGVGNRRKSVPQERNGGAAMGKGALQTQGVVLGWLFGRGAKGSSSGSDSGSKARGG